MKYLHLWWAGITRRKIRSSLTMLSIAVAFLLFALLFAVKSAFESGVELAGENRLNVTPRYSIIDPLPSAHMAQIESVPGVASVAFSDWFGVTYQNRQNDFAVFSTDFQRYLQLYPEYEIDPAALERALKTRNSALVNDTLWKQQQEDNYGWKIGDTIPINSYISTNKDGSNTWQVELAGTFKRKDGKPDANGALMLMNFAYFNESRSWGKDTVGWFIVQMKDPTQAASVAQAIDARFLNSEYETKTQTEAAFAKNFGNQLGNLGKLITSVLFIVFFTILVATGNTIAESVRERVPQLAVMKTLGFRDNTLLGLILTESVGLFVLAALAGLLAASVLIPGISAALGSRFPPLTFGLETWALGLGIALLCGVIVGILPALRAHRLNIVNALSGH
jgi:putative ABC transport system permease protein